jgi:plastocyanin
MRRVLVIVSSILAAAALRADVVTLPAAASIQGGNPFFSDVRVFNTSYTTSLDVTATYRCFIATVACPAAPPQLNFNLAPRESRAFNDMVADAAAFNAHDTAGGVEFAFTGSTDQLVVTSRLFSTFPQNSVGMFIPGLDVSEANMTSVLTSIRHNPGGGVGTFRTNVGVFNPNDGAANVTFTIFDNGTNQLGSPVQRNVPGHSGVQVSGIFEAAGVANASTENAVIVVSADAALFSYAAVIDNNTADPIFVVGATDLPQQPITPVPVPATPTPGAATPTPPAPTATPTPHSSQTAMVNVGEGGLAFVDQASGSSMTTIRVGDTVQWTWVGGPHSTTSGACPGGNCAPDGNWDSGIHQSGNVFSHTFTQSGAFPYHCAVHLAAMQGTVTVNP